MARCEPFQAYAPHQISKLRKFDVLVFFCGRYFMENVPQIRPIVPREGGDLHGHLGRSRRAGGVGNYLGSGKGTDQPAQCRVSGVRKVILAHNIVRAIVRVKLLLNKPRVLQNAINGNP